MTREEVYAPTPLNTHVYSVETQQKNGVGETFWSVQQEFPDDSKGFNEAKDLADSYARHGYTVKVFRVPSISADR